ncbi:molybdenum cofactor guanylyltransferase [Marinomonas sp. A79]|uniref:Molybdenum cofactor guanylyltransferase n=1 Tax=Marinomonas vulgaris TaxID=2823372 RepID=A0ABS5H839_9GAMM|nr:molybdenum cofactor guanylyltransferase [Marinomonas vulgaris]MBR7887866.1 molybdenum cofactor guanylyltransferase [Marinomonas vulgaris]
MVYTSLSAAVLAGGKAERMSGRDKGLLLFQHTPMAQWVAQALQASADYVFINANRNIEDYAELGFHVIKDDPEYQDKGPLSGLMACLIYADTSHLMIAPCDTPCISSMAFATLKEASLAFPDDIVFLKSASGAHPLHAILPVTPALLALRKFFREESQCRVMAFYETVGSRSVCWENDAELLNVNTPSELT